MPVKMGRFAPNRTHLRPISIFRQLTRYFHRLSRHPFTPNTASGWLDPLTQHVVFRMKYPQPAFSWYFLPKESSKKVLT